MWVIYTLIILVVVCLYWSGSGQVSVPRIGFYNGLEAGAEGESVIIFRLVEQTITLRVHSSWYFIG